MSSPWKTSLYFAYCWADTSVAPLRRGVVVSRFVGADRCVCPSLFAVFFGRIHRSAPTGTSNRVAEGVYCVFAFLGGHIGPPLRRGVVVPRFVGADRRVCPSLFAVYILSPCLRGTSNRVAEGVYCVFAFLGGHVGPSLHWHTCHPDRA